MEYWAVSDICCLLSVFSYVLHGAAWGVDRIAGICECRFV